MNLNMNITRIAIFTGLLVAGLIAGLLWRSGTTAPASPHADQARDEATRQPSTPAASAVVVESDDSVTPLRPGPAVDEATAMSMGIHPIKNPICPIMGNPTTAASFSIVYNGLLVRFCCPGCDDDFLAEPLRYLRVMKKDGADVPDESLQEAANPRVVNVDNDICPVTGKAIADSKLFSVQAGHKIRVCCPKCIAAIAKSPALVQDLVKPGAAASHGDDNQGDSAPAASSDTRDIANATCPIMGKPTTADSFAITYNGLRVRFCCPGCDGKFLDQPWALLTAMKAEGANVPDEALTEEANPEVIDLKNTVCPVMDEPVGDSKFYVVHHGLKIRLCCESCVEKFDGKANAITSALAETDPRVAARIGR